MTSTLKTVAWILMIPFLWGSIAIGTAQAVDQFNYELYKSRESFGILVFPEERQFPELKKFILSLGFTSAAKGKAKMRQGVKEESATYMMPEWVQNQQNMKQFITIQVLSDGQSLMIGIYDQEHGLTLPSDVFQLDEIKKNIPKTLEVFREQAGLQKIGWDANFPFVSPMKF